MKEKVYVYIGRFQIPHIGHEEVLKHAIKIADRVIIQVGSSELARDPKNPFTFEERKSVLEEITKRVAQDEWNKGRTVKIDIMPLHDYVYDNNAWLKEVQDNVKTCTSSNDITITGCRKNGDTSTEYLNYFPQWKNDFINEVQSNAKGTISSTELREAFFVSGKVPTEFVSKETAEFLENFVSTKPDVFDNLIKEYEFINRYIEQMKEALPYDIPFLTADNIVVSCGHVLLIRRRTYPGKGLLAMPGGYFQCWDDKDQIDTAIRELKEETKIDVPEKVLRGNIVSATDFTDMNRSLRWRILTKAVHIQLPDVTLPKVKGSDDAEKAQWIPLSDVEKYRDQFFEDHYSILASVLKL
ncbi:hypothetical protein RCIP0023_00414 [Klebsiella phage RCIP0023]